MRDATLVINGEPETALPLAMAHGLAGFLVPSFPARSPSKPWIKGVVQNVFGGATGKLLFSCLSSRLSSSWRSVLANLHSFCPPEDGLLDGPV